MLAIAALICTLGCNPAVEKLSTKIPEQVRKALRDQDEFLLYSLDPDRRSVDEAQSGEHEAILHGWKILGKISIEGLDTRKELIAALSKSVEENQGTVAACFNPRHAIRMTTEDVQIEVVICFECYSVQWHLDGQREGSFLITTSAQPLLDQVLTNAGIPLPPKK